MMPLKPIYLPKGPLMPLSNPSREHMAPPTVDKLTAALNTLAAKFKDNVQATDEQINDGIGSWAWEFQDAKQIKLIGECSIVELYQIIEQLMRHLNEKTKYADGCKDLLHLLRKRDEAKEKVRDIEGEIDQLRIRLTWLQTNQPSVGSPSE